MKSVLNIVAHPLKLSLLDMEEIPGLVEGDMILSPAQKNGLINPAYLWPNATVTYQLDPNWS